MPLEPLMDDLPGVRVDGREDAGEDLERQSVLDVELDPEAARTEIR